MKSVALLALSMSLLKKRRNPYPLKKNVASVYGLKQRRLSVMRLYQCISAQRRRLKLLRTKRPRRWWVRPLLQFHEVHGAWFTTIPVMMQHDPERFVKAFRMTPHAFDRLLKLVEPHLKKTSWRKPICPGERLAITLRYLVSGDSFESLELYFLVSEEAISNIVFETTTVIWHVLKDLVMEPTSKDAWLRRAAEFEAMWHFPHCIGVIDGKHIRIQAPPRSASRFRNYKDFFSFILLAVCDAKMRFTVLDVGGCGRRGDGNVYHKSRFGQKLRNGKLHVPPACPVDGVDGDLPFFFIGDAAFQRSTHMLAPFKGTFLYPDHKLFNYRLSRARGRIENAFGLLCRRYQVFDRPLKVSYACAKSIVLCCCALHNLHLMDDESVIPHKKNMADKYNDAFRDDGVEVLGRYRHENPALERAVLSRLRAEVELVEEFGSQGKSIHGLDVIESLIDYFIDCDLPWQWKAANLMDIQ